MSRDFFRNFVHENVIPVCAITLVFLLKENIQIVGKINTAAIRITLGEYRECRTPKVYFVVVSSRGTQGV